MEVGHRRGRGRGYFRVAYALRVACAHMCVVVSVAVVVRGLIAVVLSLWCAGVVVTAFAAWVYPEWTLIAGAFATMPPTLVLQVRCTNLSARASPSMAAWPGTGPPSPRK